MHVDEHRIVGSRRDPVESRFAGLHALAVVTLRRQHLRKQGADGGIIFDDENLHSASVLLCCLRFPGVEP
jgi:hypothetical protein